MPLRRMLEQGVFDPRSTALLLKVFDETIADLDLRTDADREKAAKIIIRLANRVRRISTQQRYATTSSV